MPESKGGDHQVDGLMTHFYRVTDVDEIWRLAIVAAKSDRAGYILYNPRYLPRMARHILRAFLLNEYDARTVRRTAPYQTVSEIAAKVRLNNLTKRPLEEGVEDLIATVQDPNLRMYVEGMTAFVISVVVAAQQTKEKEADAGYDNAKFQHK